MSKNNNKSKSSKEHLNVCTKLLLNFYDSDNILQSNWVVTKWNSMSSNGAVGCPEDMQVESALEGSLKHRDAVINKQSNLSNSIADTNGKH